MADNPDLRTEVELSQHSLDVPPTGIESDEPAPRAFPRKVLFIGLASVLLAAGGIGLFLFLKGHNHVRAAHGTGAGELDQPVAGTIPVNTVRPRRKLLQRTLEQPGSIQPLAQAELFAKASGYLASIQRIPTAQMVAEIVLQRPSMVVTPISGAARLGIGAVMAFRQAPQIDIGAPVTAGELLMEIAAPERAQEIVEKTTLVYQRDAELEAARTALNTFEATIAVAKAQKQQAQADVRRYASEYSLRMKEWKRLKDLVASRTITAEVADEKENQVNAALAAWESSQAKVLTADAELSVISSKLTTARAEIKVKETLVQIARDALRLAVVLADYNRIYAPFDGVVTYRGVDEGDFIQNATSGQSRKLMTVTALDRVKVVVQAPDRDAPWIQIGAEAVINVEAHSGKAVIGRVIRTANALDPQTRTMQVEIDLDNRNRELLPGMYGKVSLVLQRIPNAAAIPATAVYSRKGENFILQVADGVSHRQRVRIRFDDGKEMEVVKLVGDREVPLTGDEELIVSNKGEIAEGQRVKTTLVKRLPEVSPAKANKESGNGKRAQTTAPIRDPFLQHGAVHAGLHRRMSPPRLDAAAHRSAGRAAGAM